MSCYAHLFKPKQAIINEIIRVNHAGELGAKYIYMGQLDVLKEDAEIIEMLEGELEHLDYFTNYINKNNIRPSILNSIWQKGAFLMGFISAKCFGRSGAMLCTKEVESVIEKHYESQIDILKSLNLTNDLKTKIINFREDEVSHLNIGQNNGTENKALSFVITNITKLAILLSKKF